MASYVVIYKNLQNIQPADQIFNEPIQLEEFNASIISHKSTAPHYDQ